MDKNIILFDGVCNFCNFWINFLLKRDKEKHFLFAPLQSAAGQEYLNKFDLDPVNFESFILIDGNKYFIKSDAALLIAGKLPTPYSYFYILRFIPKKMRDWIYSLIAKYRYKIFGKRNSCRLPEAGEIDRFLPL